MTGPLQELIAKWRGEITVTEIRETKDVETRDVLEHSYGLLNRCADELEALLDASEPGKGRDIYGLDYSTIQSRTTSMWTTKR